MKQFIRLTIAISILLTGPSMLTADDLKKPAAFVKEPIYTFPATLEGTKVNHDFVIANKGDSTLVIENVKPTCGCTTTSFTKNIEPGGTGEIKTRLKTDGQGGRHLKKAIKVYTNDPENKMFPLTLTGDVTRFADIQPASIHFQGDGKDGNEKRVTIKPLNGTSFKIKDVTVFDKEGLTVTWQEIGDGPEKHYEIIARNIKKDPGRIHNRIVVHTDSKIKPEIVIRVSGNVKQKG